MWCRCSDDVDYSVVGLLDLIMMINFISFICACIKRDNDDIIFCVDFSASSFYSSFYSHFGAAHTHTHTHNRNRNVESILMLVVFRYST